MIRRWSLPAPLLALAAVYVLALAALMVVFAVDRPWMGLRLGYDQAQGAAVVKSSEGPSAQIPAGTFLTEIGGGGSRMILTADDFILETDGALETYDLYEEFLRRQTGLAEIQASAEVTFLASDGRSWTVVPELTRPIATLPTDFWVQIAVGVIAWLISAAVWVFRRSETSARYLLLSGWSTALFAPLAAVYSTRELAIPGELFRWLTDLNFLGGSLFAGTLVALLTCYPRRIGPRWLGWVAVLAQLGWFVAQETGAFESMVMARRLLVMVALLATFVLAFMQWFGTRKDPVGRASLRWFLLSWVVCTSVFALLILLPQMFGFDTSAAQGYSFLLFLLVYVGLGFGILRFRLFGLDEWWGRIMTWLAAVAILVVLDLLFLLRLNMSTGVSLSLSLLICGVLWLPLRGYLAGRFFARPGSDLQNAFKAVVDVALSPSPENREMLWHQCLQARFAPLRLAAVTTDCTVPELAEDGLVLNLPAIGDLSGVRLEYARGGRSLFSPRDVTAANELSGMLSHVIASRLAYETGVSVERGRIARDIHDNIGAQLLSALHSREEGRREELLRGALGDLRGIINDTANPDLSVAEALAELRFEVGERLEGSGLTMDWRLEDEVSQGLPVAILNVLRPLVRESVSNVLKHAHASRVSIRLWLKIEELRVEIEDDGTGFAAESIKRGNGLTNMDTRLAQLGGFVERNTGEGGHGARVVFVFPLQSPRSN